MLLRSLPEDRVELQASVIKSKIESKLSTWRASIFGSLEMTKPPPPHSDMKLFDYFTGEAFPNLSIGKWLY